MQAGNALQVGGVEMALADAQTRARRTGVIDGHRTFGMLGVEAQAALYGIFSAARTVVSFNDGPELPPLSRGIKDNMVRQIQQLGDFRLGPGGGESMHFTAELLPPQARFIHGAGANAPKRPHARAREQRKGGPGRIALKGQQNFRAGAALHLIQNGGVGRQTRLVQHEAGGRDRGFVRKKEVQAVHVCSFAAAPCVRAAVRLFREEKRGLVSCSLAIAAYGRRRLDRPLPHARPTAIDKSGSHFARS